MFSRLLRISFLAMCVCLLSTLPVAASSFVTGNGFGFAVVSQNTGNVTKFFAHPYSFSRPDPHDSLSEGIPTTNFISNLGWKDASATNSSAVYLDDSQIIQTHSSAGEGTVFMPFGLAENTLIITWQPSATAAPSGHLEVEWSHRVKSSRSLRTFGIQMQLLKFDDIPESLLLVPFGWPEAGAGHDGYFSTNLAWALIPLEDDSQPEAAARAFLRWRQGLSPSALVKREIEEVERWRVRPSVSFRSDQERHLWRQSEVLLRMAQCREPNRPGRFGNGLIVAALPDGAWFTPWVRDMAYAALAFERMGHRQEARAALLAYFNARPTGKMKAETGGQDYQVSVVRYFGDGSEEPFFTNEGSTNIEYDGWGLVLWVLGDYLERYNDPTLLRAATSRGSLYDSAKNYVMKPLVGNLEKYDDGLIVAADTSIWEERQKDKKHFAFSTAAAIVGLKSFAEIAHRVGDETTRSEVLNTVMLLQKGFNAAFVRGGRLHGTLEEGIKNDVDGALLAIINLGVVKDPAVIRSTVDTMDVLKVVSGGYRRVRSTYTDPAIYEYWYERQEFLFVDFSLAEVYRRMGRDQEAESILKRIVTKTAADHNYVPEMYVALDCQLFHGAIGDPTGAIPMVGYGAGVYVLDLLQRAELQHRP